VGVMKRKEACPACKAKGNDWDDDNLIRYMDDSAHCFACGYTEHSDEYKSEPEIFYMPTEFTEADKRLIMSLPMGCKGFRGLDDSVTARYRVRHSFDETSGEVDAQYYPYTHDGQLSGYKIRSVPKDFRAIGKVGRDVDMFGYDIHKATTSKFVVIASGEVDALSAYQMLNDGKEIETPVLSGAVGEKGSADQYARYYEWFLRFEKIILIPDNDKAGKEAIEAVAKVMPRGKLYIMELPMKDANEMLRAGREREFIKAFWNAKPYAPAGVSMGNELYAAALEEALRPRLTLPPFMADLQAMLAGGIPLGTIVNIGAASGVGKTTIANEIIYRWCFDSPYLPGIVSMELSKGEYFTALLSRHIGMKIARLPTTEERFGALEENADAARELLYKEDGSPRFVLMDDRDADLERFKATAEKMIVSMGVQVLVFDPLQDLFEGLKLDQQEAFMGWQKSIIKRHPVILVNINHFSKSATEGKGSEGKKATEEGFQGTSSIYKSGGINIIIWRNKMAEDPVERNTLYMEMPKCRHTGDTGFAGKAFYNNETHTLGRFVEQDNEY